MSPSTRFRKPTWAILFCIALLAPQARADSLRGQLESLAKANSIVVEGLDRLDDEPARPVDGDAAQQIKALLSGYNFMAVGTDSKIERLVITSPKQLVARPQVSGTVKTQRIGTHHQVQAVLNGPNNGDVSAKLLVDTGATNLVLPESMIAALGFTRQALRASTSQTAGGSVAVKTGLLKSVKVGDVLAWDVSVSFVADQKLGATGLLGMSFLNRFRFSLDDESNELLLLSK